MSYVPVLDTVNSGPIAVIEDETVLPVPCTTCVFLLVPPPLAVPVVIVPSDARKILPLATSDAVAVVTVASSNRAVPPPVFGSRIAGQSA